MFRFRYRPAKTFLIMALFPAVATLLLMLTHYLGGCSGGYKSPVNCALLPDAVGDFTLSALFIGVLLSISFTPAGLALVVILETFVRFWKRKEAA